MRKITEQAIQAFYNREPFKQGNTVVHVYEDITELRLHNNTIATLTPDNELKITNAGWTTNTTKERLNGLKRVNIHQKDFQWYLNGKEWNGEWIEIA